MTTNQAPRAPRYDIRLGAEIRVEGQTLTGTTRNLSTGGVCVELPRPMAEGAMLTVRLFLVEDDIESASSAVLEINSTVQWSAEADQGGHAVGLRFTSLNAAQLAALAQTIKAVGG